MTENDDTEQCRAQYSAKRPFYERLVEEVCHTLKTRFSTIGFTPATVVGRAKSVESFAQKIGRKRYENPFEQTTDLAGARVVCAYQPELDIVASVIDHCFEVVERIDKSSDLGVDRMGYNGRAFVVRLGSRNSGARYDDITNLKCEIQVRTILQDAWAIIDHHLVYKNEANTPDRLRRDLNNVASLLEVAQDVFDKVREKRDAYIKEIETKQNDQSAFLEQPVDYDTLIAFTKWKYPNLPVSEQITQLVLRDIDPNDFPKLRHIDSAVTRAQSAVNAYRKENPDWFKFGTDYVTKSLGFTNSTFRAKHGFANRTRAAFEQYKNLVKP
jgi:ppGpp synthetase/RelA/SpoT-type nucleotidyltranferase